MEPFVRSPARPLVPLIRIAVSRTCFLSSFRSSARRKSDFRRRVFSEFFRRDGAEKGGSGERWGRPARTANRSFEPLVPRAIRIRDASREEEEEEEEEEEAVFPVFRQEIVPFHAP